ncbi:MAG: hypothetical protein V1894_00760 [Chloroflexota bacterium]
MSLSGTGFSANSNVTITFADTPSEAKGWESVRTNALGSTGSCNIRIGEGPAGTRKLMATDLKGNSVLSEESFTLTPSVTLVEPKQGQVWSNISVQGKGFLASEGNIEIRVGNAAAGKVQSDYLGNFYFNGQIPEMVAGSYDVVAVDSKKIGYINAYPLVVEPAVKLGPLSGLAGTTIRVKGGGFIANARITARWDGRVVSMDSVSQTDAIGSFSGDYTAPSSYGGSHELVFSDGKNMNTSYWVMKVITPTTPKDGGDDKKQGSLLPIILAVVCVGALGLASPFAYKRWKKNRTSQAKANKRAEKALKKEQKKLHQEQIQQLIPRILEMAQQNRGAVTIESITKELSIEVEIAEECLKRLKARHEDELYYIPAVEKSYRKKG